MVDAGQHLEAIAAGHELAGALGGVAPEGDVLGRPDVKGRDHDRRQAFGVPGIHRPVPVERRGHGPGLQERAQVLLDALIAQPRLGEELADPRARPVLAEEQGLGLARAPEERDVRRAPCLVGVALG